jgi:hypothetical protein
MMRSAASVRWGETASILPLPILIHPVPVLVQRGAYFMSASLLVNVNTELLMFNDVVNFNLEIQSS